MNKETANRDGENRRRVLIVNAWGSNRGDEAMLNMLCRILKSLDSNIEIDITPFIDEDLDICPEMCILRKRVGKYYYQPFFWIYGTSMPTSLLDLPYIHQYRIARFFKRLPLRFLKDYDLVISAPQGPSISDIYPFREQILHPLQNASTIGIPYAILGVSMGPFNRYDLATFSALKGAEKIVVREDISLGYVTSTYPELTNVESAIDLVFFGDPDLTWKPAEKLEKYREYLKNHDESCIGATISLTPARYPDNPFSRSEYLSKMAAFFDFVIEKTDRDLILFPHLTTSDPDGFAEIQQLMLLGRRTRLFPVDFDSDFQRDLISKLEFFISSRYHPSIFAIDACIPLMCIKNQYKVDGLLQKLDLRGISCWQDESLPVLQDTFEHCWFHRRENTPAVSKARSVAKQLAQKYEGIVQDLLN